MKTLVVCLLALTAVTTHAEPPKESVGFSFLPGAARDLRGVDVAVVDEFTGTTLGDARIEVTGSGARTVTVTRPGYTALTVYGVKAGQMKVFLKPVPALATDAIANGKLTNGLPGLSGHVDGGLILRSLGISDLLTLNMDSLLSPLKDTIQLLGPRQIPSNLVFPDQRVGLVIRLNKPIYRLPVSTARRVRLLGVQAAIHATSLLEMPSRPDPVFFANLLKLRKIGWTSELSPTGNFTQDISLTTELRPRFNVNVGLPPFAANLFALSLTDLANDRQSLVVSDVKAVRQGTYELNRSARIPLMAPASIPSGAGQHVITAAVSEKGERISAVLSLAPSADLTAAPFLDAPLLSSQRLPATMKVQAGANGFTILSLMEKFANGGYDAHHVVVLPAAGEVEVPLTELASGRNVVQLGLAQLEFSAPISETEMDGVDVMKSLSRFTFSRGEITTR